ncbi:MAG: hypothetical protein PHC39_07985 [Proteiniphilum sp.]|nr:hypothetical protein [Proteiniphilum sp.]
MSDQILIREIQDSDYEPLAEFNASFPNEYRTKNEWLYRYRIWWDYNPAYQPSHPRGVIALSGANIIGTTNNFPTKMIWEGEETTVVNGSTWRVLPQYRKHSMDIWHKHRELTQRFILFNTSANPNVVRLLKLLRASEFNIADKWFYYFGSIQGLNNHPLLGIVSFTHRRLLKIMPNYKSDIREGIPNEADVNQLWQNNRHKYDYTNIRDYEYTKWLNLSKQIFSLYNGDTLLGYYTFHVSTAQNTAMLVDYWPEEISGQVLNMILAIIRKYPKRCIIIPSYNKTIARQAAKALLIARKTNSIGYVLPPSNYCLSQSNSLMTMLQGDRAF